MRRTSLSVAVLASAALLVPSVAEAASWSTQSVADPSGALTTSLGGVACAGRTSCLAAGRWESASSIASLAAVWSSGAWSPRPPAPPIGTTTDELYGVSCTGASACTAVGIHDVGTGPLALVQRWTGSWTAQAAPAPAGATSTQLAGVSCSSGSACTAVGSYTDGSGTHTLALRWSAGAWTVQATPNAASYDTLAGVSCDASENCTAVGTSFGVNGPATVALARSGGTGTWTAQTTPAVSGAGAAFLSGVSCDGSGLCTAVGVSTDATTGDASPLAMTRRSGRWALTATPPLPAGAQGGSLAGISCTTSGTDCTAVGSSYDSGFVVSPLAEDLSGTTWSDAAPPLPSGSASGQLAGVSCSASLVCTAVGAHTDANGDVRSLIDRYQ